jgi:hypothetical protein
MAENNTKTPPLVDLKVTNPVEYIKLWWKKIIGNEGVDFRLHFHPLTALLIAFVIAGAFFGIGVKFEQIPNSTASPTPTPNNWKETAFTGTLQYSATTSKYFLTTTSASEAIRLQVPNNLDLQSSIGKRILVIGSYNKSERLFIVSDAKNLEILPKTPIPIPTTSPSPSPVPTSEPTPVSTPSESTSPTP